MIKGTPGKMGQGGRRRSDDVLKFQISAAFLKKGHL